METEKVIEKLKHTIEQCHSSKECWENEQCCDCYVEVEDIVAIETILQEFRKQDKMIELMAEYLEDELTDDICNKENCYADEYINGHCQKCLNCIKQYFEKKVEESE